MQDAHHEDDVPANRVNHDVRQSREHQFARAGSLSGTAAVRECQEGAGASKTERISSDARSGTWVKR
jgi:hypothetical protein